MKKGVKGSERGVRGSERTVVPFGTIVPSLPSQAFIILFLLFPLSLQAQVAPVTGWVTTVDSATQQIMLRWRPSADSTAMGYHICSGTPCLDYDTVFGRMDTAYICLDHSPLERHTYRLHVFDSAYNVSALTPPFGNMVLEADVPECETTVSASWTPYEGIPEGIPHYTLQVRLEPFHEEFVDYYSTIDSNRLQYAFELSEAVIRAHLRVKATGSDGFLSLSNTVTVERRTADTANVVEISAVEYDSIRQCVNLMMQVDTAFGYTLYRSIDGTPWRPIDTFQSTMASLVYTDADINPYDSLHCYQLGVKDACGMNERYSATQCVVVPDPPAPGIALPNVIVADGDANGTFRPMVRGLMGTLYELCIYNRMGLLVFRTDDPQEGWTPPADMPQGAYTYFLRCQYNNNDIKTYAGTVLLIK